MSGIVAYQGRIGAFGEEACRLFLPEWRHVARPTFEAVAQAVASGAAERGMLPEENAIAGEVPGIRRLINQFHLEVVERRKLAVRLHLLARPGVRLDSVKRVSSHPMAIGQCRLFLQAHGLEALPASNTATAAEALAASDASDLGVLASEHAAQTYRLAILVRDVQDRPDNFTSFCVVRRPEGSGS